VQGQVSHRHQVGQLLPTQGAAVDQQLVPDGPDLPDQTVGGQFLSEQS